MILRYSEIFCSSFQWHHCFLQVFGVGFSHMPAVNRPMSREKHAPRLGVPEVAQAGLHLG